MIDPFKLMDIMEDLTHVTKDKESQVYNAVVKGVSNFMDDTKHKNMTLQYPCFEGMMSSIEYAMEAFGEEDDDLCTWFKMGRVIYDVFEYIIAKSFECEPVGQITSTEFKTNDEKILEYSLVFSWAVHCGVYDICLKNEDDYVTLMFLMSEFMNVISSKDKKSRIEKFMDNHGCYPLYAALAFIKENDEEITGVKTAIGDRLKDYISNIMFLDTISSFVYLFNRFHKEGDSRKDDMVLIFALFDVIAPIVHKNGLINKLANSILSSGFSNLDDISNRNN